MIAMSGQLKEFHIEIPETELRDETTVTTRFFVAP
jgi:hypothetical protein